MTRKTRNPFNMTLSVAAVMTVILFLLQVSHVIVAYDWFYLIPLFMASCIIAVMMIFAIVVYLITFSKKRG